MKFKPWAVTSVLAVSVPVGLIAWHHRRLFTVNDVTTGESDEYPYLQSRVYYTDVAHAMVAADQSIRHLARWRVVHIDSDNDTLDAEVESKIAGFLDDVTVYCTHYASGQTRVIIRSHSRQGRGDLGQNADHIKELQRAMDERLNGQFAI